jgi:hypothetical protein
VSPGCGLSCAGRSPPTHGSPTWLDRVPFIQVPDETRMKQNPFPCENVVKQIAGINALANNGVATDRSRPQMARFFGAVRVMPRSDQETVLHALEHARRIVGKCIAGQRDATRTVLPWNWRPQSIAHAA